MPSQCGTKDFPATSPWSWHSPPCTGEHKIGVSANWGWCFAQHLWRADWCFGVVWCREGEAELVRPPKTGSPESQWVLGATLTPRRAQCWHPRHGKLPAACPALPAHRVLLLSAPRGPLPPRRSGAGDASAAVSLSPCWHNHHPSRWVGSGWKYPSGICLQPLPRARSILSCFTGE